MSRSKNEFSTPKKLVFWIVLLSTPLLFFAAVEGVVRLLIDKPVGKDPYLNTGAIPSFFDTTTVDGKPHHRVSHDAAYRSRNIVFAVDKSPDTLRVFALGGSASAGWPHPREEIYSVYLQQALQRAYPDRRVEVINVSAHAYASYRVRMIFDKVIDYDPDLIVLWTGNNEFLERRTYLGYREPLEQTVNFANRFATFRLSQYLYQRWLHPESSLSGMDREQVQYEMWSKIAQVALTLRKDPEQFRYLQEHYAYNVDYMVRAAGERDVPVVLVTVPTNVRDWRPNVSYNLLAGDALERWKTLYDAGRKALLSGDAAAAIDKLQQAAALEPQHARTHFHLGQAFEAAGRMRQAIDSFYRAKDVDGNPFRALSAFNGTLKKLAGQHPNAHLADADLAMRAASAPLAPGFELFLDYVHPTKKGNLIVAEAVFESVVAAGLFGAPSGTAAFRYEPQPLPDGTLYSEASDYELQRTILWLFGMMHQYESMADLAQRYSGPEHPRMPFVNRVAEVFPRYVELLNRKALQLPVDPERAESIVGKVRAFYRSSENEYELDLASAERIF